jgi:hypothetical protein
MISLQKTAGIVGALFLIAMAASLFGATIIESILSSSDYFTAVSENKLLLLMGVLLELINGISVVGIAVLMFPLLKKQNESKIFDLVLILFVSFRKLNDSIFLRNVHQAHKPDVDSRALSATHPQFFINDKIIDVQRQIGLIS